MSNPMFGGATPREAETTEHRNKWSSFVPNGGEVDFDALLLNEFRRPAELRKMQNASLQQLIQHSALHVPFYREVFLNAGITPDEIQCAEDLARLPILTRIELNESSDALQAARLAPDEGPGRWMHSGGTTTGRPARVLHSRRAMLMFDALKAREARWFRLDPNLVMGELRLRSHLPVRPDVDPSVHSITVHLNRWRFVGRFFRTGQSIMTSSERPVAELIDWIRENRVAYLKSNPGILEQLAFFCGDAADLPYLKGILSISAQLTPGMRQRIESTFQVPVHQNYGLNEVGIVASRCSTGRYHVHTEHCLVEIVDEAGEPCPPGRPGRILVTSLTNLAMPLLRYDTDDVAVASEGNCPCGRTLPAFERIEGRYRRYAFLPKGTRQRVNTLSDAVLSAPVELVHGLRRYQVHQRRDESFELRLQYDGALPSALQSHLKRRWREMGGVACPELQVLQVESVTQSPGGKFLEFTSEFSPSDKN